MVVPLSLPAGTVPAVPYARSEALLGWIGPRREAILTMERAHRLTANVVGPGRPGSAGRPLAHAYVLRLIAEFQGFVRDLHDLAVQRIVVEAVDSTRLRDVVQAGMVGGRAIDRGNAGVDSMVSDFTRIGMRGLRAALLARDPRWAGQGGDQMSYGELMRLRNALAHGNEHEVERLRLADVPVLDTLTWARRQLPSLNRIAQALDRAVWDHLRTTLNADPW